MAWSFLLYTTCNRLQFLSPKPSFLCLFTSHFSTSFLITKTPKKFKKRRKNMNSPRTNPIQTQYPRIPHFENLFLRDAHFRFLTKTKSYLFKQPQHGLQLDQTRKLHQELGFPKGRNLLRSIERHPLFFKTYRHTDAKMWFGFSDFMETLLDEERCIWDKMERDRVNVVRKLLMMSADNRILLSKICHCRLLFGLPEDFGDRVLRYPNFFKIKVEKDGKSTLELVNWDPSLAVSVLEKEFMVDEDRVKSTFKFTAKHGELFEMEDKSRLNLLNPLPLVSPYSNVKRLALRKLEAEKYRVGVIHEFLNLTLEKRASIHHIVEFKKELSLTQHTYQMLLHQPQTFYLAGTETNWVVFLKDGYGEDGKLINKDPQLDFNEKLYRYAEMQEMESGTDLNYRVSARAGRELLCRDGNGSDRI